LIVDGSGNGYLKTVCDYVHLNPARAKLFAGKAPLSKFRWSSYTHTFCPGRNRPSWLQVERLFGADGIPKDSPAGRQEFERRMEARRAEGGSGEWKCIRGGWMTGRDEFRKELLARMEERVGLSQYGAELRESDDEKARRINCSAARKTLK
jgi:hypothetical protein